MITTTGAPGASSFNVALSSARFDLLSAGSVTCAVVTKFTPFAGALKSTVTFLASICA